MPPTHTAIHDTTDAPEGTGTARTSTRSSRTLPAVVAAIATAVALLVGVVPAGAGTVAEDPDVVREIVFPIVGRTHFSDTFGACRSGCTRGHEGTDLMAAQLTPLVAARDGRVRWVKTEATPDGSSGNYVFLEDDDGWQYWYIHLNNDSPGTDDGANPPEWILGPGIERGARVRAGQLVGFVGDSGNAENSGHHLHFEIHNPAGEVVNPYPSLIAAPRLPNPLGSAEGGEAPTTPSQDFVAALYEDFLGRPASDVERAARLAAIDGGAGRATIVEEFTASDAWIAGLVDGFYRSTLGRSGDAGGTAFWTRVIRSGQTPADVAAEFYASEEYHRRVGGTDPAWVQDLYEALLGRDADQQGLQFWLDTLAAGSTRSVVAGDFYQSLESRRARVRQLYDDLLGRSPDRAGLDHWAEVLTDGRDLRLASFLAASDEYLARAVTRAGARVETRGNEAATRRSG